MIRHLDNQKGVALITALLFLLVLSLLIVSLHNTTLLEHISSRKYQNSQKSFYAAERGIRRGMGWLAGQGGAPEDNLTADPWFFETTLGESDSPIWSNVEVADGCSNSYYIEYLKDEATTVAGTGSGKVGTSTSSGATLHYYRITGKGKSSGVPSGTVVLQLVTTVTY